MNKTRRPRLWLFAPRFCGVSEVWMYRQANGMQQFDVTAVSPRIENEENFPAENFGTLAYPAKPAGWNKPAKRYFNYLRNYDRGFYRGPVTESKWIDEQLSGPNKPDVILAHYGTFVPKIIKHALHHEIPVVAHFNGHDASHSILTKRGYAKQLRKYGPVLAGSVVVADYMREALVAHGISETRIRKIPYGVSCSEFVVSNGIGNSPCRFLGVGNFVEKKRPDLTIESFANSLRSHANSELVLLGDGPLMEKCVSIVKKHKICDKVTFLGRQLRDRVRQELKQASVFVQHSVTSSFGDKEGWPVAIGEAAASGLPIISTNHASIPEQVQDGVSGFIVEEHDVDAMAESMVRLSSEPRLRQAMSVASRAMAESFELAGQIKSLEDYLLECSR